MKLTRHPILLAVLAIVLALPAAAHAQAPACPCTVFAPTDGPLGDAVQDSPLEIGMKFRSDSAGFITALRFYKQPSNTGVHTGHLWSSTGQQLAEVTFSNETASGWQEEPLPKPVAITAGTTYITSYYSPNGRFGFSPGFFGGFPARSPLSGLRDGLDGGNGVYHYGQSAFPADSWNATNYWIDAVFNTVAPPDTRPPHVSAKSPGDAAVSVAATTKVKATFDEPLDPVTVNAGSFTLRDAANTPVVATVAYDSATNTVTLTPSSPLAFGTTYTATLLSGNAGVTDAAGNRLPADITWTFSTAPKCPCSVFTAAQGPGGNAVADQPLELGMKLRSSEDGFITSLRFNKQPNNTGTHVGHLWSSSGQLLASATYTNETASGWQQVDLPNPVPVTAGVTYVTSYYSPLGRYPGSGGYFTSTVDQGPLKGLANGIDGGNGVYRYGASAFPADTWNATNYWVDAVFDRTVPPDTRGPSVTETSPTSGSLDIDRATKVTATFDEPLDPATVKASTFTLRDADGHLVAATVAYDAGTKTASVTPTGPLSFDTNYTARLSGGTGGVTDVAGNTMTADKAWMFTTMSQPPTEGPGGPILLVGDPNNKFSGYYAEILRSEGLNAFSTTTSGVTSANLAGKQTVLLAAPVTDAEVATLSQWVQDGGNLIALRPDKKLAPLLGLADASSTLSNAYLKVDTSTAPGAGIDGQTMQFHGTADRYTLNGASSIATLYSDDSTATSNPAVTLRDVGTTGGQAAAFTYDLARSVVYTRQGNPAWAGQKRDGTPNGIRADDLFYGHKTGDVQPDWVDPAKIDVPQADEQQRLLANLVEQMNLDKAPLPRFWYLPRGEKAAVVLTGDDHAVGGLIPFMDRMKGLSPAGCSVADWQCVRGSVYMYVNTPITDAQAAGYQADGFEIGLHFLTGNCLDFTPTSIQSDMTTQLSSFANSFPSLNRPASNRTHCIVWSDWATQPKVERAHGIRFDTNYYYNGPSGWLTKPGLLTGSGFPQRFADLDGTMIDAYQAMTQVTDESELPNSWQLNTLLDNALGSKAYYGVFTLNTHTDYGDHNNANNLVDAAMRRHVPVVSSKQMLDWTDGRNGSSFAGISYSGGKLSFSIAADSKARGLQAMLPARSATGPLSQLTRNGQPLPHTNRTVKGVDYVMFDGTGGDYVATYADDTTPPAISGVAATADGQGHATVSWTTDEPSTSRLVYGPTQATVLESAETAPVIKHSVDVTGLVPDKTYYFRVSSTDSAGNTATEPAVSGGPSSFRTPVGAITDSSVADFLAGTASAAEVGSTLDGADGEVQLQPTVGLEFSRDQLPATWTSAPWFTGGWSSVLEGKLVADSAAVYPGTVYDGPRSMDFVATFPAVSDQAVGFGNTMSDYPFAAFTTGNPGDPKSVFAETGSAPGLAEKTALPGVSLGHPHRFRVEWTSTGAQYYVDGALVATHTTVVPQQMRPVVSDYQLFGASVRVDWLRMGGYGTTGTIMSRPLDGGPAGAAWQKLTPDAVTPAGTQITYETRSGASDAPDAGWSAWQPLGAGGTIASPAARYIEYRATLKSSTGAATPTLQGVRVSYAATVNNAPVEGTVAISPANARTNQTVTATPTGFSDPDGDTLSYRYQWLRNNKPITGATATTLNLSIPGNGDKGDVIKARVYALDGKGGASEYAAASFTVANTAPTNGTVSVRPAEMSTNDLLAAVPAGYADLDGDPLTYRYQWFKNEVAVPGATSRTYDLSVPGNGDLNDTIDVEVRAVDTSGAVSAMSFSPVTPITGTNSTPIAGSVSVSPANPKTDQVATATPAGFRDPDGDPLTYSYAWFRNGTAIAGATSSSLDLSLAGHGDRGDTIRVDVTATDPGGKVSDAASQSFTIGNSAPTAGTVTLKPTAASTDDILSASVSGFRDADGDALTYQYRWYVNGTLLSDRGRTLDLSKPGNGDLNDIIQARVTAIDPTGDSSPAVTASQTITGTTPNPVASFGFEETSGTTAIDDAGAHDGVMQNGVTRTANGKFGRAMSFDGIDGIIRMTDDPALHLTTGMTLEAWVKPQSVTEWRSVIFKEQNAGLAYALYGDGDGHTPSVHVSVNGGDNGARGMHALDTNAWSYLSATYDGSRLRFYLNGTLVGSKAVSGDISNGDGPLTIGGNAVWGEHFKGLVDEVRIYNRPLSAAAIGSDMQRPVVTGLGAPAVDAPADQIGSYAKPINWPIVQVHSALTSAGKVVGWDGFENALNSERQWDPVTGRMERIPSGRNLFCAGHVTLEDGRLLVAGGHSQPYEGLKDTNLYQPKDKSWTRGEDMAYARWYPTLATLPDGKVFVAAGDNITLHQAQYAVPLQNGSDSVPEVYDPVKDQWTQMPTASRRMPLYPFLFVLPDGRLFDAGPDTTTRVLDLTTKTWSTVGASPVDGMSAVMYRPGKIMKAGTWSDPEFPGRAVTNAAAAIDMTQPSPQWRSVSPMANARSYFTMTMLPDGKVLASGGQAATDGVDESKAVMSAEMWDPSTDTWTTMASYRRPRLYHSTSLLLPDGRVLLSGGGAFGSATDEKSTELYSPPYLFKGPRPSVTTAPSTIHYGQSFAVGTPDASTIKSVALTRLGAVTHNLDMDQRYVPMTMTAGSSSVSIDAPANANTAPPGWYMVWLINDKGVPSVGQIVQVDAAHDTQAPTTPTNVTATTQGTSVKLAWTASNDNVGVSEYRVYRSTTQGFAPSATTRVGTVAAGTAFSDDALAPGKYYYRVVALDAAGNRSPYSSEQTATVGGDTTAPTVTVTSPTAAATVTGSASLQATATDNVKVTSLQFKVDGANVGAPQTPDPTDPTHFTLTWDSRTVAGGAHTVTAVAGDASGNTKTSAAVSVTVNNTAPPAGLVAAYGFEESSGTTATDSAGTNNGAITGATRTPSGRFGSALSFDGVTSWVTVPDASALGLSANGTIEAWVNPSDLNGWRVVVAKEQASALAYALYAGSDENSPLARLFTTEDLTLSANASLPLDDWSYLTMTWDGNRLYLYVNGTLVNSRDAPGPLGAGAGPLRIGGDALSTEFFKGLIDEVRVYNRPLTQAEIQADMNSPVKP